MFGFHDNHGSKIALSDNQQTAERTGGKGSARNGIVMSRDPMQVNRLYEVSLSQALNNNNDNNDNDNDDHDDDDDHGGDERMIIMMVIANENNNDDKK